MNSSGFLTPARFLAGVAILLAAAYANHFQNGFHFDDSHAIQDNIYVRYGGYIPRYFTDASTFSVLPLNQSYRPLLQTTFAVAYRLGGGYNPLAFHIGAFIWYILLFAALPVLFRALGVDAWVA